MGFIQELRRRNVIRVGIAYVLVAWVALQLADFILEVIDAPSWVLQVFVLAGAIGLIAALFFAWVFELTPEGIKRESELDRSRSITAHTGRKLDRLIIVGLVAVVAWFAWDRYGSDPGATGSTGMDEQAESRSADESGEAAPRPSPAARPGQASIAVLPFVNMSADPDNEFFSDGVSEELLNVLARIPELKVAARTSAFAYKGTDAKIADIARELGVENVLEGSVRKSGNQVRVTAQLIKADDGFHLWSETYDRELDNIFAIQDDIAGQIAAALRVTLALDEQRGENLTGTTSLQAYEHYLRGMALWHQRTADSLRGAVEAFDAALAVDPDFAKAHAGLALTWSVYPGYVTMDLEDAIGRVVHHAERATSLDPENTEALAALANAYASEGRLSEAAELYDRAIELSPSFATAYQWYGRVRVYQGDYEAAQRLMQRAHDLDPRSRIIAANLAWAYLSGGELAQAAELMERAVQDHPDFPDALSGMMVVAQLTGRCDEIEPLGRKLARLLGKEEDTTARYRALCEAPDAASRNAIFREMLDWGPFRFSDPASRHLTYDIEFWTIATHYDAHDAALAALESTLGTLGVGESGWMRNDLRPGAIRFNCSPEARALYEARAVPATANTPSCD